MRRTGTIGLRFAVRGSRLAEYMKPWLERHVSYRFGMLHRLLSGDVPRTANREPRTGMATTARLLPLLFLAACTLCAADPWDRLAEASRLPPDQARAALEKQLLEQPDFLAARFNLGTLLLDSDPAKAAEQLELAAAGGDAGISAEAAYNLALARFKQGHLEQALAAAERAATLDPQAAPLRDEIRRVTLARQDEARRKAEDEARKLHLDPQPLPPGRVGVVYQAHLPISGGTPPATVTLAGESKMPDGVALAPDGAFSGTPRVAGTTHLDLALKDAAGGSATGAVELHILPQPAITTEGLPEAILGQAYSARLTAVGFSPAVRWEIAALPAGLRGAADGTISGTPTAAGTATVHVHAGEGDLSADRLIDLVVSDSFAPAEDPLPPATATAAYTHRVTVRGPTQNYRWSVDLTAGMSLAPDGTVSGTPVQAGAVKLPATIAAADGRSRQVTVTIPVNPLPLIGTDPVQLQVGRPADHPLQVTGGTPPYTWTVADGALPAGIRLDPDGHLRGAAKDPGKTTVTVAVTDHWQAGSRTGLEITVEAATDPPPKQDDKDKKDGEDNKDGQDQDKQGDQSQTAQQPQGDKGQDGKQDPQSGDQQPEGKSGGEQQAKQDQDQEQQQAATLNQTAAGNWLDQLPEERRDSLRYQLLDGGAHKPEQHGKAW